MVVSFLECYFLIKYLYSFEKQSQNVELWNICDVYLKSVLFLSTPLNYWN